MAAATSPGTGRPYGAERVCHAWDVARSSFYAWRRRARSGPQPAPSSSRRGPKPAIPDEALLAAIRADLARELGVPVYRLEQWRERALAGIAAALKERDADPLRDELGAALRRIGELTMANELLRARVERPGPLARRRSR